MSTNKGTNEVPPLEDAPPEPESEEEIEKSSDEYEPVSGASTERKRKSEKKTPKSPKTKKRKKEAEVKPKVKTNVQKKLSKEDIDEIMKRVESLPDDEPIMVMHLGALLTGKGLTVCTKYVIHKGLEISCSDSSKVSHFLERILMEHRDMENSLDSNLIVYFIYLFRILETEISSKNCCSIFQTLI